MCVCVCLRVPVPFFICDFIPSTIIYNNVNDTSHVYVYTHRTHTTHTTHTTHYPLLTHNLNDTAVAIERIRETNRENKCVMGPENVNKTRAIGRNGHQPRVRWYPKPYDEVFQNKNCTGNGKSLSAFICRPSIWCTVHSGKAPHTARHKATSQLQILYASAQCTRHTQTHCKVP